MPVTTETLALQQTLRDALSAVNEEQVRTLAAAWADAWDEVSLAVQEALLAELADAGDSGNVTTAQLLRSVKLQKALAAIADQLDGLSDQAREMFIADLQGIVDAAGAAQEAITDSQLPALLDPDRFKPELRPLGVLADPRKFKEEVLKVRGLYLTEDPRNLRAPGTYSGKDSSPSSSPVAFRLPSGEVFLVDGHHRAQAALSGEGTVTARVQDLTQEEVDRVLPDGLPDLAVPGTASIELWARVDPRAVEAIINRTTQQITNKMQPLSDEAYAVVQRELVRGVALGKNPRETAARMVRQAEGGFNGGLNRAMVIARTETLDAHRAAAALAQAEDADVLAGWKWLAKLDGRTCRSCWAQHGKLHDLDELGPLDHQQGRCSRLPVTKTWAELGFDDLDDDEPDDDMPDAEATFDALPSTEQLRILGPKGYAQWLAGTYPIDRWTRLVKTPGWRDSYHETRPAR